MAQTKNSTQNTFEQGLVMDFAPERAGDKTLSNALNATFLTFNGNEWSLQNDMGNARVETAYLPTGYVPVGTCEFGDIIYIVSYNPIENKSQIGCFPSPERNISNKEKGGLSQSVSGDEFAANGQIKSSQIRKIVYSSSTISPGDKYIISWKTLTADDKKLISNYGNTSEIIDNTQRYWPKLLKVHVVSIEETGKITQLDSTTRWYTDTTGSNFIISDKDLDQDTVTSNLDTYRSAMSCQYSVFQSKIPGKLALYFELETIDGFSCGHKTFRRSIKNSSGSDLDVYDIYLSASWETNNYNVNPCGMLITDSTFSQMNSYYDQNNTEVKSADTYLAMPADSAKIYECSRVIEFTRTYKIENPSTNYKDFYNTESYYKQVEGYQTINDGAGHSVITTNALRVYETDSESKTRLPKTESGQSVYVLNPVSYQQKINDDGTTSNDYKYFTIINGQEKECQEQPINDDIIVNYFKKSVLKYIGTVTPNKTANDKDDKEDMFIQYTVCPCMPYGVLESLATTNTIYFNRAETGEVKLRLWQYYVNSSSITLRFSFDTYLKTSESEVIDKVIMEFYDNQGICASYELTGQETYDATFTEYFELDRVTTNPRMFALQVDNGRTLTKLIPHKSAKSTLTYKDLIDGNYDTTQYYAEVEENGKKTAYLCSDKEFNDNDPVYLLDAGVLYYGRPYGVRIKIFKGTENELGSVDISGKEDPIVIDRWLWTAPLFNDSFNNVPDFKDCQLEIPLDFQARLDGSKIQIDSSILQCSEFTTDAASTFKMYKQCITSKDSDGKLIANLTISGTPTLADTYGNTLFLRQEALSNITVNLALGDSSISFDTDAFTTEWEEGDYGDLEILHPTKDNFKESYLTTDPDTTKYLTEQTASFKDCFELDYFNTPEKKNLTLQYLNGSGESTTKTVDRCYTISGDEWKDTALYFKLRGVTFTKAQAQRTKANIIKNFLRRTIETIDDLENILNISYQNGQFYHKHLLFLGLDTGSGDLQDVQIGIVTCNGIATDHPDCNVKISSLGKNTQFAPNGGHGSHGDDCEFVFNGDYSDGYFNNLYYPFIPLIIGATYGNQAGNSAGIHFTKTTKSLQGFWDYMNAGGTDNNWYVHSWSNGILYPIVVGDNCYLMRYGTERYNFNVATSLLLKDKDTGNIIAGTDFRFYYAGGSTTLYQKFPWTSTTKTLDSGQGQSTTAVYNYAVLLASLFLQVYSSTTTGTNKHSTVYTPKNIGTCSKYSEYWNQDILVNQYVNSKYNDSPEYLNSDCSSSNLIGILPEWTYSDESNEYQGLSLFGYAACIASKMYPENSALNGLMSTGGSNGYIEILDASKTECLTFKNINPKLVETTKAIAFNYSIPFTTSELRESYVGEACATILFTKNANGEDESHMVDGFNDTSVFYTYDSESETISKVSNSTPFKIIKSLSTKTVDKKTYITGFEYFQDNPTVPLNTTSVDFWEHVIPGTSTIHVQEIGNIDGFNQLFNMELMSGDEDPSTIYNLRGMYLFDFYRA